jgi:hypothetical protein
MVGIDGPGDKLFRFIFNSSNNHHISSQGNNSAGMSNPPPPGLSVNLNIPTNSSQSSYHTIDGYQHADMKVSQSSIYVSMCLSIYVSISMCLSTAIYSDFLIVANITILYYYISSITM